MHKNSALLFSGSSHPELTKQLCQMEGITSGRMKLGSFPDGEIAVEIQEDVREKRVFVLQTIAGDPNRYLCELLIMIDALKRASAQSIVVIIPYLGYCRQDRKDRPGVPITAKLVANLLAVAGATRIVTFDLHADQVEGFFEIPVDHLHCQTLLAKAAKELMGDKCVVVAPDLGSIRIAEEMAKLMHGDIAVMKKRRISSSEVEMTLIGDVAGRPILLADDLCSTGGTLVAAAELCRKLGAKRIIAAISHGLFVEDSLARIESSPIELLLVANSLSHTASAKLRQLSLAPQIAKLIYSLIR